MADAENKIKQELLENASRRACLLYTNYLSWQDKKDGKDYPEFDELPDNIKNNWIMIALGKNKDKEDSKEIENQTKEEKKKLKAEKEKERAKRVEELAEKNKQRNIEKQLRESEKKQKEFMKQNQDVIQYQQVADKLRKKNKQ